MFQTLANAWKIAELRKKIIFTLLILLIYRIGNAIPVPYVDVELMAEGRAEGLMLHLGGGRRQRQEGSVPARGQTRCFHVHLVPAVGSRVAAAAAAQIHRLQP